MNTRTDKQLRLAGYALLILIAVTSLYMARPMGSNAKSATELQNSIDAKRAKQNNLSGKIDRMSGKIQGLRGRINKLQSKQNSIEVDLDRKVSRQQQIAGDLKRTRARLQRLRAKLKASRALLAERIVTVYKEGEPSIITVVLNSNGFEQMVQRTTYLNAVATQDRQIISDVLQLKGETKAATVRLAKLEKEASTLVALVKNRRDEVASTKNVLDSRRDTLASAVGVRKKSLAKVSSSLRKDEEDLAAMQKSSSAVQGYLVGGGKFKAGSGQLSMPVDATLTSPFGPRWGRLHAGLDLAAPEGRSIWAADSGTVRYAGWMSGYGNYTCIQHTSSLSSCYAHQSRIDVRVGQSVKKGQTIGAVGNTGNSFGAHLHFETRLNGNPVDPFGYM